MLNDTEKQATIPETPREPIRQTWYGEPCPKCGSVYRRGDLCNWCGEYCPERRMV